MFLCIFQLFEVILDTALCSIIELFTISYLEGAILCFQLKAFVKEVGLKVVIPTFMVCLSILPRYVYYKTIFISLLVNLARLNGCAVKFHSYIQKSRQAILYLLYLFFIYYLV